MGKYLQITYSIKGMCQNIEVAITHYLYAYLPVWTVDHLIMFVSPLPEYSRSCWWLTDLEPYRFTLELGAQCKGKMNLVLQWKVHSSGGFPEDQERWSAAQSSHHLMAKWHQECLLAKGRAVQSSLLLRLIPRPCLALMNNHWGRALMKRWIPSCRITVTFNTNHCWICANAFRKAVIKNDTKRKR